MVERAVERVVSLLPSDLRCAVVAIDGHSAAGKTTFAAVLAERVSASVLHGDDFYRVMDEARRAGLSPEQGVDQYYDWQRMREEALEKLRGGHDATFRPYDWKRNDLAQSNVKVRARPVVIVEGLFVAAPQLADLVAVSVLVTADEMLRVERQLARGDASAEWLARWDAAERWYFETVRPPETFDVIAEGA